MEGISHPLVTAVQILLVIVITKAGRIPAFHRQRLFLKTEDNLEGEAQHSEYYHIDYESFVEALNRL